ncbi:MAG TPA: VOC family protein, partial [Burkholderiales bacterium]|nr:VOC family protein [Burkholderiales bacterium]
MTAKLKHIALVSDNYALQGKFYEAAFGMRTAADPRPERAVTVSDGYVGLNINPRKPGRPAGLDHFGLEVDEVEPILAKLKKHGVEVVQRPSTRPFAGISTHDPAGNIFDLSQRDMANRTSVYVEAEKPAPRRISHLALRTLQADRLVEFYAELGLKPVKGQHGNFQLTDGRVALLLMPWRIGDYEGTGIVRPGPDHLGFDVESLEAFKSRLQELGDNNPHLRAKMLAGKEGEARMKLFASSCP